MKKWEYTLVQNTELFGIDDLNELGAEGWELVTTYKSRVGLLFILKREKEEERIITDSQRKNKSNEEMGI